MSGSLGGPQTELPILFCPEASSLVSLPFGGSQGCQAAKGSTAFLDQRVCSGRTATEVSGKQNRATERSGQGRGGQISKRMTKICAQCEMEHSADGLMEQMCSSDFVVKMRIKEIKIENGDRKLIGAQKKKKLLKPGPLKRKDTKRLVLHMKNGASCPCPQLDSLAGSFLVMGRKVDGQLLLMAVYRWDKKNKEMKFAVKFMFSYPCSLYYPFFYGAAEPH
ncbi:Secreted frizzled-related protein 5 [Heterocephalus glaber]|uniref:Secreted frizzled-related protein 5 n=1 Tax=Heterocephalus glaber TaxID=10181 RepID=G5C0B4_HETGA|nr:Secreted frizzled-related protein 5 [Heterocephalus glaber]